jgi:hypothetical protein
MSNKLEVKIMSTSATMSAYTAPQMMEMPGAQLSQEELDKLQEIHELINLMFREFPLRTPSQARNYFTPALPAIPYTHTFFSWRMPPYSAPPGF